MNRTRRGMLLVSLFAILSMLLAACGTETPTNTPVVTAPTNTAAVGAPTNTTAAAPPTNTAATAADPTATTGGNGASGGVIKIGVNLPTSGADASSGVPTRNGVELAIEQANEAGGVTIAGTNYTLEMYALDDAINGVHNPEQGAKNAQAFIADPAVMAVVGPFNSNVARAMMPILNEAGLAQISPANTNEALTKPEFGETENYRPTGVVTYFRVCTTDDIQGPALADFMFNDLGAKQIYILDDTETYGKGLADNVEKRFVANGGTVLGHEGVPKGTTDYRTILTKIQALNPDALFYGGTTSNGLGLARRQMADIGFNVPFVGGDGIQEAQFLTDAGEAAEGSYSSVAAVNATLLPEATQFLADYEERFGEEVGAYSANAYEAANIIIDALGRATAADREAVRQAISETQDYKGVIGTTSFDENGDTTNRWIAFYEATGGAWVFNDQLQFTGETGSGSAEPTAAAGSGAQLDGDVIKIGVNLPTSGADASIGVPTRNGVELAVEQANAAGGVTIAGKTYQLEMYALDDAINGVHNPEQGAKNAQAFIADPAVLAMVGPFNSNVARAMMPIVNEAGLAQISPSNTAEALTKPEFGETENYRPTGVVTYFRVCTTDDIQGPALADLMYNSLGFRSIYILDDTETYGKGLADNVNARFVANGGTVLGHEGVPKGTTDYRTILTKIQQLNPDALFYGGTTSTGLGLARRQMADIGFNVPFVGGDGIQDAQFLTDAGEAAEGTYSSVAAVEATLLPEATQFLADYQERFGEPVGAYSANAYEAANIIIDALKRSGGADRESVRAAIAATKDYKGVIGTTSFDENGDTTNRWIAFYTVKEGAWSFTEQINFTE